MAIRRGPLKCAHYGILKNKNILHQVVIQLYPVSLLKIIGTFTTRYFSCEMKALFLSQCEMLH